MRRALRVAIEHEASAYGFALVIWTTGQLSITARGEPGRAGAVSFVGGALAAMIVTLLVSFGGPTHAWHTENPRRFAFGGVHVLSVSTAIAVGWFAASALHGKAAAFATSGFVATLVYQIVLGIEVFLSMTGPDEPGDR
ncbi:MAG TPA: hypothetical protein VJ818_08775 [Actinomycetota bacterium]|nr:hypothetical protein [Actinomycetota bacterium]